MRIESSMCTGWGGWVSLGRELTRVLSGMYVVCTVRMIGIGYQDRTQGRIVGQGAGCINCTVAMTGDRRHMLRAVG